MSIQITPTLEVTQIDCFDCGIPFWVQTKTKDQWVKRGETFYCPNGHSQWFGKGRAERLEEELAQKKQEIFSLKLRLTEAEKKPRKARKKKTPK